MMPSASSIWRFPVLIGHESATPRKKWTGGRGMRLRYCLSIYRRVYHAWHLEFLMLLAFSTNPCQALDFHLHSVCSWATPLRSQCLRVVPAQLWGPHFCLLRCLFSKIFKHMVRYGDLHVTYFILNIITNIFYQNHHLRLQKNKRKTAGTFVACALAGLLGMGLGLSSRWGWFIPQ
jgi:hypothetical protein